MAADDGVGDASNGHPPRACRMPYSPAWPSFRARGPLASWEPTLARNGAITDDATLFHAAVSNRRGPLGLALGIPDPISVLPTRLVRDRCLCAVLAPLQHLLRRMYMSRFPTSTLERYITSTITHTLDNNVSNTNVTSQQALSPRKSFFTRLDRRYPPCSRCKADNAICVFGERKRSHDKHYPKGYVEMLEQQQSQLVAGLKEMYHRLQKASAWDGATLDESTGQPLTHDILSALDLLEPKHDDSSELEVFEENCEKLQSRMLADGVGFAHRRGSISSDSEHSHHDRPKTSSRHETPVQPKLSLFKESFNFPSATSSPLTQSPIPRSKPLNVMPYQALQPTSRPLSMQMPQSYNDPQLYAPEWAQALAEMSEDPNYRHRFSMQQQQQSTDFDNLLSSAWDPSAQAPMEPSFGQFASFNQPQMLSSANVFGLSDINDLGPGADSGMDFDFSKFVQQTEVMT
ncbi:hypothetical protein Q7P37_007419 [Cladosporium fusiforme]